MAKASKVNTMFDVAAGVTLRDITDGAETSTATETPISLSELDTAYWHNGEIPHGVFEVVVYVTACDAADGDETYVFSLQVDDAAAHNDSPVTIATATWVRGTTGVFKFLVDSKSIPVLDTDSSGTDKWLAIKATLGGTSPSITYGAFIAKSLSA